MKRAAVLGLFALAGGQGFCFCAGLPAASPAPDPQAPAPPSAASMAAPAAAPPAAPVPAGIVAVALAVDEARVGVDAELGALGGGPLTLALRKAARRGLSLRILLDPSQADTRALGAGLAALSATAQVRWHPGAQDLRRWLRLDQARQLAWYAGENASAPASEGAARRFERDWQGAWREIPESYRLNEQLRALPDPSETSPHYVRRAGNGAP